jgi:6-phosphofructokinase 1
MDDAYSERGLDTFGRPRLGGIGEKLAPLIEEATGIETRATTLGHIQRGGTPSAFDRVLATRFGMSVVDLVNAQQWGHMVSLRGTEIQTINFSEALGALKTVPAERYEAAAMLFG